MKFCWCTIAIKNMNNSVKFYKEVVGLSVNRLFAAGPGTEICFLGDGETKVELICGPDHKAPGIVEGISLGFEVKSLDEKLEFVKKRGLEICGGPFQPNPHIRFFYIKDPDGVKIQFVENIRTQT